MDEKHCTMTTCFHNSDCCCTCASDLCDPSLLEECLYFTED